MTVTELRKALERLEAEAHGEDFAVVQVNDQDGYYEFSEVTELSCRTAEDYRAPGFEKGTTMVLIQ